MDKESITSVINSFEIKSILDESDSYKNPLIDPSDEIIIDKLRNTDWEAQEMLREPVLNTIEVIMEVSHKQNKQSEVEQNWSN